jgi:hypothetical protein
MRERICADEDCDRPAVARALCRRHYYKWRRAGGHPELFGECAADGCSTGVFTHGLCYLHYNRERLGVDLDQPLRYGRSVAERFWAYIDKDWDCWIWQGRRNACGYGTFGRILAHRFAYERLVGPIPDGMELDHLCGYRDCVDPSHLEPVTHAENARRAAARRKDLFIA